MRPTTAEPWPEVGKEEPKNQLPRGAALMERSLAKKPVPHLARDFIKLWRGC